MITVNTTFTLPKPINREEARGIYLWNSRVEAEAMYTEQWRSFVREKYGTDPTVTYFESPAMVDNVAQQIFSDE